MTEYLYPALSDSHTYTKGLNMSPLRSTVTSLGFLLSMSVVSLPVWATPQSEQTVSSAANLGEAVSVSNTPLPLEAAPSSQLIQKVNAQLGTEIARNSPPQRDPSFRWQSELLDSQRRSETGYQFYQSNF